jgi:hypothetical protein
MMFRVLAPFRLNVSEKRAVSIFNTEVATLWSGGEIMGFTC